MQYEMARPTTEAEAVEIISAALLVIYGQIEVYRGDRKKAWNGEFVDHCRNEAIHSLAWLADRYPKLLVEPTATLPEPIARQTGELE